MLRPTIWAAPSGPPFAGSAFFCAPALRHLRDRGSEQGPPVGTTMTIAHQQLNGLDAAQVAAVVDRVLSEHGLEGVELLWRTDQGEWLLEVTVEVPGSTTPGEGVSLERCVDVSRDLSAALDASELIESAYRLEVGSPGLDRALYLPSDFSRFAGLAVCVKLSVALDGQKVLRGTIIGLDDSGNVQLQGESGVLSFAHTTIDSARLIFDWGSAASKPTKQSRKQSGKTRTTPESGDSAVAPRIRKSPRSE
jgi:ribosome maturation factor RimP